MLLTSVGGVEQTVGFIEAVVGASALFFFWAENERLPGQWLRWTVKITSSDRYDSGKVHVNIRRKSEQVRIATLDPTEDDFPTKLADAESLARERCVQLNVTGK